MIIIYTNKREQVDVSQQGALFPTKALSFSSKEYLLIPRLERTVSLSPRGCHPPGCGGALCFFAFFPVYEFLLFFSNSFVTNLLLIKESKSLNVSAILCKPFLGNAGGPSLCLHCAEI